MRFEESKGSLWGHSEHTRKVTNLVSDFLKSGFEVAEVKDWEDAYLNANSFYSSLRRIISIYYKGQCHASKANNGRVFLVRD